MALVFFKPVATNQVERRIQSHASLFQPFTNNCIKKSKQASAQHATTDYHEFEMHFDPSDEKSQRANKAVHTF
jgi:hypothetical protein